MIYVVIGRETIATLTASIGFTASQIPPTKPQVTYAKIQAVGGDVRFCIDGSTPSTVLGMRLPQDSSVEVWGGNALTNFRCINDGGTATLEVIYMGQGG